MVQWDEYGCISFNYGDRFLGNTSSAKSSPTPTVAEEYAAGVSDCMLCPGMCTDNPFQADTGGKRGRMMIVKTTPNHVKFSSCDQDNP